MTVAIVLAAGRSERIGRPKALLPCRGKTFLRTILDTLLSSRVDEVRVVLGHEAEAIIRAVELPEDLYTINRDYDAGMLSSVQCGIRALPRQTRAFLLWPVDHPLVRADTVDRLIDEFLRNEAPLVVPTHEGKRGHPAVFDASLAAELMEAPASEGARAVVRAHERDRLEVPVDDEAVAIDINTPQAYRRVLGHPIPLD